MEGVCVRSHARFAYMQVGLCRMLDMDFREHSFHGVS
jgi:hypothetical protein